MNFNYTIEDLSPHFDKTLVAASKELKCCTTILKRICRNLDIPRWPYRKLRNIANSIDRLERKRPRNETERESITMEILDLKLQRDQIMKCPQKYFKGDKTRKYIEEEDFPTRVPQISKTITKDRRGRRGFSHTRTRFVRTIFSNCEIQASPIPYRKHHQTTTTTTMFQGINVFEGIVIPKPVRATPSHTSSFSGFQRTCSSSMHTTSFRLYPKIQSQKGSFIATQNNKNYNNNEIVEL